MHTEGIQHRLFLSFFQRVRLSVFSCNLHCFVQLVNMCDYLVNITNDEYDIDVDVFITIVQERPVIWDKILDSFKLRTIYSQKFARVRILNSVFYLLRFKKIYTQHSFKIFHLAPLLVVVQLFAAPTLATVCAVLPTA